MSHHNHRILTREGADFAMKIGATPLDLVLAGYGCTGGCRPESADARRSRTDAEVVASLPPPARWDSKGRLVSR